MEKWRRKALTNTTPMTGPWPALPLAEWKNTYDTVHRWTQIVGKIRLALTPFVNHWWNSTLYITPRGLTTTSSMYYNGRLLQIDFDFISHLLLILTPDNPVETINSPTVFSGSLLSRNYGRLKIA